MSTTVTPPQRKRDHVPNSKSSDSLPSPSHLFKGLADRRLKTGSLATTIPDNVPVGFQSTSTLLKFNLLSAQKEPQNNSEAKTSSGKSAVEKPSVKKRITTKHSKEVDDVDTQTEKIKRPRKRKSDEMEGSTSAKPRARKTPKAAEPKKPRTSTRAGPSKPRQQRKSNETKVAPPKVEAEVQIIEKPRKKTSKSSTHFVTKDDSLDGGLCETRQEIVQHELEHELAVKRKTKWTPPKTTTAACNPAQDVDIYSVPSSSPQATKTGTEAPSIQSSELQQFAYERPPSKSISPVRTAHAESLSRPAKRIELVPDPGVRRRASVVEQSNPPVAIPIQTAQMPTDPVPELAPKAPKERSKMSPKKGPGGITARSIARYAIPESEGATTREQSKTSPHFAPIFEKPGPTSMADQLIAAKEAKDDAEPKKPTKTRKPRAKKGDTEKQPKKAAKVKIVPPPPPKIVSPKQHEARVKRQEVLFGTSSQLRSDLSPNMVRGLQQSLHEQGTVTEADLESTAPIAMRHGEAFRRTRRTLWNESVHANSNPDDGFQDISEFEVPKAAQQTDLSAEEISAVDAFAPLPEIDEAVAEAPMNDAAPVPSNGFWLSRGDSGSVHALPRPATPPSSAITISSSPRAVSPPRVALRHLSTNTRSPSKSPVKQDQPRKPIRAKVPIVPGGDEQVKADIGRSPNKLNREVNQKIPKARGRPRKVAASSPGPRTPRKRGRPREVQPSAVTSPAKAHDDDPDLHLFKDIDDIEDSEPDFTPSPRRKTGSPSASQVLPLTSGEETELATKGKRTNTAILNASHPRWPVVKSRLFAEITTAVKGAPPTGSIKNPSWHEKILLYDPIVLEDLTSWVNDQGLRVEGKDGALAEVSPWMVQAWCEMNSICCLWKEGLRGGVRVRY